MNQQAFMFCGILKIFVMLKLLLVVSSSVPNIGQIVSLKKRNTGTTGSSSNC